MLMIKRTRWITGAATLFTAVLMLGASAPTAVAAACQTPLFVQEATIDANVMLLVDNSGSMATLVQHPDFDPAVVYPGGIVGWLSIPADGMYTYNGNTAFMRATWYEQNYVNWIFWHATDEQRANLPNTTRIEVVHAVFSDFIANAENVLLGLSVLNPRVTMPGRIVLPCGADKADLLTWINALIASGGTPLAASMEAVLDYYTQTGVGAPIEYSCQKNFAIVMTDGIPNTWEAVSPYLFDADGDGNDGESGGLYSDMVDDVAYYMRHTDLRDDLGELGEEWFDGQNVITYTIGFGVDLGILQDAADNGDGLYYSAADAGELMRSLELIMQDIIRRMSSGAAVAVVSTERGIDNRLFRGKFMPSDWIGYLEAFDLPYNFGDPVIWEAGQILADRNAADRTIFTAIGANVYDFTVGQAANIQAATGSPDVATTADLITWTRGDNVAGYRDRDGWKLGDIIHSTPAVVGVPADYRADENYQTYAAAQAGRAKMVYVGANDGMLHAFYASSGHEAWAFVPEFALPKLADIADTNYCHVYTVDQSPSVHDAQLGGVWRTVLVSGGRQGGSGYFAIDVTAPSAPQLLWQIDLPNSIPFSSKVEFATIGGQEVVLIGSGLDEVDGDAFLYEYELQTGNLIGVLHLSHRDLNGRNKATTPRTVDLDLDGEADVGYIGDLAGNVWRLQFNNTTNSGSWDISALYTGDEEITATPVPAFGDAGAVNVYFGTGAYLDAEDLTTRDHNRFVCVFDRHDGNEDPDLKNQTDEINDVSSRDGWWVNLEENDRERVTEPAIVVAGAVFFTSFAPNDDPCGAGGESWLYRMQYNDGDVPDDGEEDDFNGSRVLTLDEGIASRAVVDIVNETVIVQSSDASIDVEDIGQLILHLNVRSWQEEYDHVVPAP